MGLDGLHVGLQGCLPVIWSEERSALSSTANRLIHSASLTHENRLTSNGCFYFQDKANVNLTRIRVLGEFRS